MTAFLDVPTNDFRRFRVDNHDVGSAAAIADAYGLTRLTASPAVFSYGGAGDRDLTLRALDAVGRRGGIMHPREDHIVAWIADGAGTLTGSDGAVIPLVPGHPVMLAASVEYVYDCDTSRETLLHLSDALLRRILGRRGIIIDGDLRFEQQSDLTDALAPLRTGISELAPSITDPALPEHRRREVNERIAAAVLHAFPLRQSTLRPSTATARAVAYLHANLESDITLADVAAASGLTARGIQEAFRRSESTTPMTYLRQARLDAAHVALTNGDSGETVADIARRFRFNHLGRFADTYRRRFRELPSDTLHAHRDQRRAGG